MAVLWEEAWKASALLRVAEVLLFLFLLPYRLFRLLNPAKNPSPELVASKGRPQCFMDPESLAHASRVLGSDAAALNELVEGLLDRQLRQGRQLAVVVPAYYKGVEIVHVGCGLHRTHAGADRMEVWKPVTPRTRFLVNSVSGPGKLDS